MLEEDKMLERPKTRTETRSKLAAFGKVKRMGLSVMALTVMSAPQTARESSWLDILDVFPAELPDFGFKSTQASQSALSKS